MDNYYGRWSRIFGRNVYIKDGRKTSRLRADISNRFFKKIEKNRVSALLILYDTC